MLKFQNNNTTVIATFEDFILTVYVIIDELYHQFAPPEVTSRRHILDAKLSDPEIITISICGELAGIDSENAWFSFVKKNYRYLFPNLCSRSRFNRTRRALLQTTELLRQKMISVFPIPSSKYFVIDSFPLAVCKFGRARYCRSFRGHGAVSLLGQRFGKYGGVFKNLPAILLEFGLQSFAYSLWGMALNNFGWLAIVFFLVHRMDKVVVWMDKKYDPKWIKVLMGAATMSLWTLWDVPCTYPLLERIKPRALLSGSARSCALHSCHTSSAVSPLRTPV